MHMLLPLALLASSDATLAAAAAGFGGFAVHIPVDTLRQSAAADVEGSAASIVSGRVVGRVFGFVSTVADCSSEPRTMVGDDQSTEQVFATDVDEPAMPAGGLTIVISPESLGYPVANMSTLPTDRPFCVQAVFQPYDVYNRSDGHVLSLPRIVVNRFEGGNLFGAPGTLYSKAASVKHLGASIKLSTDQVVPASVEPSVGPANDTDYIKHVRVKSKLLSTFWGRDVELEACVLLPAGFKDHPDARYPVFLYQGHYHADFATPAAFAEEPPSPSLTGYDKVAAQYAYWLFTNWSSLDAGSGSAFVGRRGLIVTLKHPTPYYDDSYAVNSAANGPYGDALVHELLPAIEKKFRGIGEGWARATYGGSTGGWESIAVQVFYPEEFNGCWTFCPDPISFQAYTTVNIYKDQNAYFQSVDKWKRTPRSAVRDHASNEIYPGYGNPLGEVQATQGEVGLKELVFGTHSRSTQQWDIWEAVFSPLGEDGYPARIWNKLDGTINKTVAAYWRDNFDLQHILERDWTTKGLGAKLEGKLHIWVGASDTYYLNDAVFYMEDFLAKTTAPYYNGTVQYGSHDGRGYEHCFSGDDTVTNSLGRLTINTRVIPQMVERMLATAPAGADTESWRY